jgi:hypothetical protein
MEKQQIAALLSQGIVRIVFQKKDKSTRVLLGTTHRAMMPPPPEPKPDAKPGRPIPESNLLVWDTEAGGLRSFDINDLLEEPYLVRPLGEPSA